jgi:serine/threonine protein kinase
MKKKVFVMGSKESGIIITLEIMKKYKSGSLSKFEKQFDLNTVTSILSQLLLAQLHAYYSIGFLHNDIKLENILLSTHNKNISYSFCNKQIKLNVNMIPIISDFDKSKLFTKEYFENKETFKTEYDDEHNILQNLIKTFNMCLLLLKDKNLKQIIQDKYNKDEHIINHKIIIGRKNIRGIYKYNHDYQEFIKTDTGECFSLVNMLYRYFTNNKDDELIPQLK